MCDIDVMWIDGTSYIIPDETIVIGNEYQHLYKVVVSPLAEWTHFSKFKLPLYYNEQLQLRFLKDKVKCKVFFNDLASENSVMIEVHGDSVYSVGCAMGELHRIIGDIRSHAKPLQFLSIPTISDEIKTNFLEFKDKVLDKKYKGVEESIFQKAEKIHLTMTVFALFNSFEIEAAIECLQKYKNEVLDTITNRKKPLDIVLEGIDIMQKDAKKCNVLYAKARFSNEVENCNLKYIANSINNFFYMKGFCKEQKFDLKLHATLMNTKYRQIESKKMKYKRKVPFNAADIIKDYENHYFGKCNFSTIELSLMSSVGDNGYYKSLATIEI